MPERAKIRDAGDAADEGGGIRVLVAHGQPLLREAIKVVLESGGLVKVVAEAGNGCTAVDEAERTRPEVALVDAELPRCEGARTVKLIRERAPGCRVLVHTEDAEDVEKVADTIEAGADGVLAKDAPLPELTAAIRRVHEGDLVVAEPLLRPLLAELVRRRREHTELVRRTAQLTRREREVLTLVVRGSDTDEIAERLVISPETARTHVQHALGKLGVHSRGEARALVLGNALLEDLVEPDGDGASPALVSGDSS